MQFLEEWHDRVTMAPNLYIRYPLGNQKKYKEDNLDIVSKKQANHGHADKICRVFLYCESTIQGIIKLTFKKKLLR